MDSQISADIKQYYKTLYPLSANIKVLQAHPTVEETPGNTKEELNIPPISGTMVGT